MPETVIFAGLNGQDARDKLAPDEVASAGNIDFSHEPGAAAMRHGVDPILTGASRPVVGQSIDHIFRHYNQAGAFGGAPWYLMSTGTCFRVTGGFGSPSKATLFTGGVTDENDLTAFASFRDDVFIASDDQAFRDDGTTLREWFHAPPTSAPTATADNLTPMTVLTNYTVVEGTAGATSGTATVTTDEDTQRIEVSQAPAQFDLNTNTNEGGGHTIGLYGVHHVDMRFSEPKAVTRISMDYSIGDTNYKNYFHAELDPGAAATDATPDAQTIIDAELETGESVTVEVEERGRAEASSRRRRIPPRSRTSRSKSTFNTWSIPVPKFEFVGRDVGGGATDIRSARIVIECNAECVVEIRDWNISGSEDFPLTDVTVGYSHWETFAKYETIGGQLVKVHETGPSPAGSRVTVSGGRFTVVSGNTITSTDSSNLSHRILYAQGGYLNDAYAVATASSMTVTTTYTHDDRDVEVLIRNERMPRNIRSAVPDNVRAIANWKDRMFIAWDNQLAWSLPGSPDTFPLESETEISHTADRVNAMFASGDTLVIVNRESVYEMRGDTFEGFDQNWSLEKMPARTGSIAPRATIMTPFGILLVSQGGLFFYTPGQGIERPIDWILNKVGDIFRGSGAADPAPQKGFRLDSGMNHSRISHCAAAWKDDKLYFAYPNGTSLLPTHLIIADFKTQRVSQWFYPFGIRSLFADRDSNALLAGGAGGGFMRLEQDTDDAQEDGSAEQGVQYDFTTRQWTAETDTVLENVFCEHQGANNTTIKAVMDGTSTLTGTLTNSDRGWQEVPLNGTFVRSVEFQVAGTSTKGNPPFTCYALKWDALAEPARRTFWRTEHDLAGHDGEKVWNVGITDIEVTGTGNVLGTFFVDNTAVMTQTIAGPTGGRVIEQQSFPGDTFGEIAYVIYSGAEFKHWQTRYSVRPEPHRVTTWWTERDCGDERWFKNFNSCIDALGNSITAEVFIDNTSSATFTLSGSGRQSYARAFPLDVFGRTVQTRYSGTLFKHYDTWYDATAEPDRVVNAQWGPKTFPSEQFIRTWIAELNPLGQVVTGVLYADGTAISTETFTGTIRTTYDVGVDLDGSNDLRTGTAFEVDYTAPGDFKHYDTQLEALPKPFGKSSWTIPYVKIGGASRLDQGWSYSLEIEPVSGTATVTSIMDVDETVTQTNTLTFTGREYRDEIRLGPEMKGYIFRNRIISSAPVHVYRSGLVLQPVGVKGAVRRDIRGTPQ